MGRHTITGALLVDENEWQIQIADTPWRVMDAGYDWGIDGIDVDLDASEELSPHYPVVSNTADTLTIITADDLSGVVGSELVGVHTFETMSIMNGASVDFGDDRVVSIQ